MTKFQPPTGLTDGHGKYNTPWDKCALFLAYKYYKVQSAHGHYKVQKSVTATRVVMLVTLGGLLQVQEDMEEHLPCKSSSCNPSLKDVLAGDDSE
jgi:hypothetical protein